MTRGEVLIAGGAAYAVVIAFGLALGRMAALADRRAAKELARTDSAPCPRCQGRGSVVDRFTPTGDDEATRPGYVLMRARLCQRCNGTGKAFPGATP